MTKPIIAIHGGAGALSREKYSDQDIADYKQAMEESLNAGYRILEKSGDALDACIEAVRVMEDCPLFNAGHGAVFAANGTCELDASVMHGRDELVGAVTTVTQIKNPILAAQKVLQHSPHALICGEGAHAFARAHGLEMVANDYFYTDYRREQFEKAQREGKLALDHADQVVTDVPKTGTVGAVALDSHGNLAAATSTGGMTNKAMGRVSDSSIIGAGTYASNKSVAVSGTGTGDFFIQNVTCKDLAALMEYKGMSLHEASDLVLKKLRDAGGTGGIIAIDREGQVVMPFISTGMFRAYKRSAKNSYCAIFQE